MGDHQLSVGPIGVGGSKAANEIAANADVVLALGCRFSDWSSSSLREGVTFATPYSKPIHIDIDPIHLGIIMVVNMEIGMITPPVGLNLFVTSSVAGMFMMAVVRAALPFLTIIFVFLIMVTYIPAIFLRRTCVNWQMKTRSPKLKC